MEDRDGVDLRVRRNVTIILNGEPREVPDALTVAELLRHLGLKAEYVAVEQNRELVGRQRHAETPVRAGDELEVVTLVGGGAPKVDEPEPLTIGTHTFRSRLFVGTGKYRTLELMRDCLDASGAEVVTVAVRRERLFDKEGRNLLDFLDPKQLHDLAQHCRVLQRGGSPAHRPPRT